MAEQQKTDKQQIEISGGYVSRRDQWRHRIATLSVFGPVVACIGGGILLIEMISGGPGVGLIGVLIGIGMVIYAKLLQEVLNRW